jgi:hypothetical protein
VPSPTAGFGQKRRHSQIANSSRSTIDAIDAEEGRRALLPRRGRRARARHSSRDFALDKELGELASLSLGFDCHASRLLRLCDGMPKGQIVSLMTDA